VPEQSPRRPFSLADQHVQLLRSSPLKRTTCFFAEISVAAMIASIANNDNESES
jgi:hypothetical protein